MRETPGGVVSMPPCSRSCSPAPSGSPTPVPSWVSSIRDQPDPTGVDSTARTWNVTAPWPRTGTSWKVCSRTAWSSRVRRLRGATAQIGHRRTPRAGAAPVALPAAQAQRRAEVNDTATAVPDGLLHERVVAQALSTPDRLAVIAADNAMTYGDLLARAVGVAERLLTEGCRPGELVGITWIAEWNRSVGVLAVLLAGGVYVPVDTNQPAARRDQILAGAGVHAC